MKILHSSPRYTAYLHPRAGLIVQSARKAGGINMRPDHPQFAEYVEAISTAIDTKEGDIICRALVNP